MTDGPTGFQVAPITEDDMSRVTDILKRAADAIVGMSQLKADVDMLQATVKGLQADTERLRNQNANLDEALAHVRQERDTARTDLAVAITRANDTEVARDSLRNQVNDLSFEKASLETKLAKALADRDDEGFRVMELEEELKTARANLTKIAEVHASIFGEPSTPTIQPAPEPSPFSPLPEPLASGVVETVQEPYTPPPYEPFKPWPSADEAHKPQEPTRTYHGMVWEAGYLWDDERKQYYTEN